VVDRTTGRFEIFSHYAALSEKNLCTCIYYVWGLIQWFSADISQNYLSSWRQKCVIYSSWSGSRCWKKMRTAVTRRNGSCHHICCLWFCNGRMAPQPTLHLRCALAPGKPFRWAAMSWALFIFFFPLVSSYSVRWGRDGGRRDVVGGPDCMVTVWSFLKDQRSLFMWGEIVLFILRGWCG
jgi:hypothetical protein